MWKKPWFNIAAFVAYTLASYALAAVFLPGEAQLLIAGALAYGCGNVHFVLWFTFYTRFRKEAQDGVGRESRDELSL